MGEEDIESDRQYLSSNMVSNWKLLLYNWHLLENNAVRFEELGAE